jgi:hypothetical protein
VCHPVMLDVVIVESAVSAAPLGPSENQHKQEMSLMTPGFLKRGVLVLMCSEPCTKL